MSVDYNLKRNTAISLPVQISNILRRSILNGEFKPGKKLYSIRKLAKKFDVATLTIERALEILDKEGFLKRIPMKGIYVSPQSVALHRRLNICVPYPVASIAVNNLHGEAWSAISELYRGLFSIIGDENISLQFVYYEDTDDQNKLAAQLDSLLQYDAAVFLGTEQLRSLQNKVSPMLPSFRVLGDIDENGAQGFIDIDYDRRKAYRTIINHAKECGAETITCFTNSHGKKKYDVFRQLALESGIREVIKVEYNNSMADIKNAFSTYLQKQTGKADFMFCMLSDPIPQLYEAARNCNIELGKDLQVVALASGVTFVSLYPSLTYCRIPRFEMGCETMRAMISSLRAGKKIESLPLFEAEFIQGMTTKPLTTKQFNQQ